jgi:hypothetical protein
MIQKSITYLGASVVLTSSGYMSSEYDELGEEGNYLDIIRSPIKKRFKVRRLICRVCKLKFRNIMKRRLQSLHLTHSGYQIAEPFVS